MSDNPYICIILVSVDFLLLRLGFFWFLVWRVIFHHIFNIFGIIFLDSASCLIIFADRHPVRCSVQFQILLGIHLPTGLCWYHSSKSRMFTCSECLRLITADGLGMEMPLSIESCWHWGAGARLKLLLYHHHLILPPCALLLPAKCRCHSYHWVLLTLGEWRRKNIELTNTASRCLFHFVAAEWEWKLASLLGPTDRVPPRAASHSLVLPLHWWGWKFSFPLSPTDTVDEMGSVFLFVFV